MHHGGNMGFLTGLNEYLSENYEVSIFDQALNSEEDWIFHIHEHRIEKAKIIENLTYDVKLLMEGHGEVEMPKIQIKLIYRAGLGSSVTPLIKMDKKVKALELGPILRPAGRYFVKNKSLYPLMKEKMVAFFTLLEGEVIRGLIAGFSRYDITVHLKGGLPVTILRHSIYDLRDKKGRCFLKSFQEEHRDWTKSELYVD